MFRIRVATVEDAPQVQAIYAPFIEESAITFHTVVPALAEVQDQMECTMQRYPWYVAESDSGEVIGYAHASEHHPRQAYRWSVNTSIYLDSKHQGQGAGRKLYETLLSTLRRQGFRMVHAGITLPNVPSQRIHETLGFQFVGTFPAAGFKLGIWKDVGWWVLDLMEGLAVNDVVSEPTPFSELHD